MSQGARWVLERAYAWEEGLISCMEAPLTHKVRMMSEILSSRSLLEAWKLRIYPTIHQLFQVSSYKQDSKAEFGLQRNQWSWSLHFLEAPMVCVDNTHLVITGIPLYLDQFVLRNVRTSVCKWWQPLHSSHRKTQTIFPLNSKEELHFLTIMKILLGIYACTFLAHSVWVVVSYSTRDGCMT